MANEKTTVGIVGLGIMGWAYAKNLIAAGFRVVGFDVTPEARQRLVALGGEALASASDVAKQAKVIITALPSPDALVSVTGAQEGFALALQPGTVIIEASTLPIEIKEDARTALAARATTLLDCPVSGTGAQAAQKDLLVYASGDKGAVERCKAVFDGFARETIYVGAFGDGMKMKYIANHLVTINNLAAAEALLLAEKAGLDLNITYDAIRKGAGQSRMFDVRGPMMIEERYEPPTMKFIVHMKDLELILKFGKEVKAPLPLCAAALPFYTAALAQGRANEDTAGLFGVLKQLAGVAERKA